MIIFIATHQGVNSEMIQYTRQMIQKGKNSEQKQTLKTKLCMKQSRIFMMRI